MSTWTIKSVMQDAVERAARYQKAIEAEDDHGAIIRGLTYIDVALRGLIQQKMTYPDAIGLTGKNGRYLVSLSRALGLIDEALCLSLKRFVDLRNCFAHEVDRQLTELDVDHVISTFRGDAREFLDEHRHLQSTLGGRLRAAIHALRKAVEFAEMSEMCRQHGDEIDSEFVRARLVELETTIAKRAE